MVKQFRYPVRTFLFIILSLAMTLSICACKEPNSEKQASSGGIVTSEDTGKVYELRLGSFPGDTMTFMEGFAKSVGEASNNRIKLEVVNFLTLGSPADAVNKIIWHITTRSHGYCPM